MSDIFREIDEELRRDQLDKLWKRYGGYVIGFAVVIVLIVAAFVGWREYQRRQGEAASVRYAAALEIAGKEDAGKAAEAFGVLAREATSGPAVLARFQEAALRAKAGDAAGAIAIYKALAADGSVDAVYRELAQLLSAMHQIPTADPKSLIADLEPLTKEGSPWRPSALELTALAHLRAGERDAARDIYKKLADDLAAPQALRQRAAEMAAALAA